MHTLTRSQVVPALSEAVFEFFADPFNLEAITPPWLRFRIVGPRPIEMQAGTLIDYRLVL
ncbi:MAG: CDP-paratose 2-epimerase, partial [Thermoleophilaceae bacterium]|nr:CDP-paratose 2-epimerase [Thermoleophilaceae bacterium]